MRACPWLLVFCAACSAAAPGPAVSEPATAEGAAAQPLRLPKTFVPISYRARLAIELSNLIGDRQRASVECAAERGEAVEGIAGAHEVEVATGNHAVDIDRTGRLFRDGGALLAPRGFWVTITNLLFSRKDFA